MLLRMRRMRRQVTEKAAMKLPDGQSVAWKTLSLLAGEPTGESMSEDVWTLAEDALDSMNPWEELTDEQEVKAFYQRTKLEHLNEKKKDVLNRILLVCPSLVHEEVAELLLSSLQSQEEFPVDGNLVIKLAKEDARVAKRLMTSLVKYSEACHQHPRVVKVMSKVATSLCLLPNEVFNL